MAEETGGQLATIGDGAEAAGRGNGGGGLPGGAQLGQVGAGLRGLGALAIRGDIIFALLLAGVLVVLILPMPAFLLDLLLALSFTFSVLILMTGVFIRRAVEFNVFPMVLLISTMFRLALNLASTRLILAYGHEGPSAAGSVIEAFAGFVMQGNFVIGVIVFAILLIVNFVVITKGSTRIAEVAARFTLDGLPGRQMAIDADLSAGLINEADARKRRQDLQKEADFFGAMDGASKFVRGDAIAGLLITFINVIGGMIIGMAQHNMSFGAAADSFTRLTVGDGLVSQIPALIVSVAAGLMVSKGGLTETADEAMFTQFSAYPKALGMSSVLTLALTVLPGVPALPFLILSLMTGGTAFLVDRAQARKLERETAMAEVAAQEHIPVAEEPISTALKMDMLRLELGYGLLALINTPKGQRLTDQIKALRRSLATEVGFVMPSVRIQDNMQLPANAYVVFVKEVEAGRGDLRPNMLLVMDPRGEEITIAGEKTREPTFGLPALWIDPMNREEALFRGYTVVDPATVVTTHLTEVVRDNMAELLSYAETQKLLDELDKDHQRLVADLVPTHITISGIQRILQNLLSERISVRDLPTILEGISEATTHSRSIMMITEHVRARLARQISDSATNMGGFIPLVTLSPEWEQAFAESLVGQGDERSLTMSPSKLQEFIARVRQTFERFAMQGETPVLLTSPGIRPYVRSIVERFRPVTVVMSQNEIHPKARIKTMGQI